MTTSDLLSDLAIYSRLLVNATRPQALNHSDAGTRAYYSKLAAIHAKRAQAITEELTRRHKPAVSK